MQQVRLTKFALLLAAWGLSALFFGAEAPAAAAVSPSAAVVKPAPGAKPAAAPAIKDVILFNAKSGQHWALGRMDVDGRCKRYLSQSLRRGWVSSVPVENKTDDLSGVGSPDGQWIAFYSHRSGALNIWLMKADGSAAEALTSEETPVAEEGPGLREQLAFSPDSTQLAFVMHEDLWVMRLSNRAMVSLSSGQGVKALVWSPNSRALAFVQGSSLRRIGLSGAPLEVLANGMVGFPTLSWAGDAEKGAVLFFGRGLRRASLDKKVDLLWPTLLTPNRVQALPGGGDKSLVLSQLYNGSNEVFLADFAGKGRKAEQVTQGGAEDAWFLPSGGGLIFQRNGRLWRCGLDGKQAKPITDASVSHVWAGRLTPLECQ